jgi:hypothetical protein
LKRFSNRLMLYTFWLDICKSMRIRIRILLITLIWIQIRIQLVTLMRIRILPFSSMRIWIRNTGTFYIDSDMLHLFTVGHSICYHTIVFTVLKKFQSFLIWLCQIWNAYQARTHLMCRRCLATLKKSLVTLYFLLCR